MKMIVVAGWPVAIAILATSLVLITVDADKKTELRDSRNAALAGWAKAKQLASDLRDERDSTEDKSASDAYPDPPDCIARLARASEALAVAQDDLGEADIKLAALRNDLSTLCHRDARCGADLESLLCQLPGQPGCDPVSVVERPDSDICGEAP